MKKTILIIVALATTLFLVSCTKKEKLELYIPNDYISEDLVKEFEKANNVRVKILTFDNNEVALGLVKSGSYDLVIPSDYAIEELANEGLLEEIDYKELLGENYEFAPGLDSFITQLKNDDFDFLKYAVPYFWGSVGVLYNHNNPVLTKEYVENNGFGVIANPNLNTVLYDSSRDAFMVGLLEAEDKMLTEVTTKEDIVKASEWLKATKVTKDTSLLSDEILTDMLKGTKFDATIAYSGDAAYIMESNENYSFYIPNKTNVWADGFVIPKNSKQKELAKEFIKFMNQHDSLLTNTEEVGYSSSNKIVFNEMITGEGMYAEPRLRLAYESIVNEFQVYRHDDQLKSWITDEWEIVQAYK